MRELDITKVGEKISNYRKEQGLTIRDLSEYTGLSVGFLSNLETGKTSPTLEQLKAITNILQIDILGILTLEKNQKLFIPKEDIQINNYKSHNMTVGIIDFGYENYINEIITIEPGDTKWSPLYKHLHDESCIILEGELEVEIEDSVYSLKKHDSIYIPKRAKHRIYNKSDEKSISYWTHIKK